MTKPLPPIVDFDLQNLELFRHRHATAIDVLKTSNRFPVVIMKGDLEPQQITTPDGLSKMTGVICHSRHEVIELLCYARKLYFEERELEHVHILVNKKEPAMDEKLWDLYQRHHDHDLILYVSIIEDPAPSGYCSNLPEVRLKNLTFGNQSQGPYEVQSVPVVNHLISLPRDLKFHMVIHHDMFEEMNVPKRKLHSVMISLSQEDID